MADVIQTEDLTRRFGQRVAVDRVTLTLGEGEVFGLLGADGAGKTTLIRMLCGVLAPTSGRATIDGIDVGREPERVKRIVGWMSERFSLYPDLTVGENL